jgi:hypothetical protein
MKKLQITIALLATISGLASVAAESDAKLKVFVVTGGHGFDKEPFFKMFAENPDITFTRAEHARTNATAYERDEFLNCDVVVLYDMMRLHDEIYWGYRVLPGVTPLITTTHPKSGKPLGWAHTYGKSRVVYFQLGHGPEAFNDQNYRKLLSQGIHWTAKR